MSESIQPGPDVPGFDPLGLAVETEAVFAGRRGPLQGLARKLVLRRLEQMSADRLCIHEGGDRLLVGGGSGSAAEIFVRDPELWTSLLLGGSIGAAESYMRGSWTTPDLAGLIRLLQRNRATFEQLESGLARLGAAPRRVLHRLRRNHRGGSRRNIHAHYDLGNDFFERFLDSTLTYSSGVFESADASMEEASHAKCERLCRKLDIGPDDHVLEIGTGWGGFAIHAASTTGCRVTTTTLSSAQLEVARRRVEAAGLTDRITLLQKDYRDLEGHFDKLVSIEMIEAVGHEYMETFFRVCADRLVPEGRMALQAIVIADQAFERSKRSVDFIRHYVFPGGSLPSITSMTKAATAASDLRLHGLEDLSPHYGETLRRWRRSFHEALPSIRELGYGDPFLRMWDLYLASCEAGFEEHATGLVQLVMARPGYRQESLQAPA